MSGTILESKLSCKLRFRPHDFEGNPSEYFDGLIYLCEHCLDIQHKERLHGVPELNLRPYTFWYGIADVAISPEVFYEATDHKCAGTAEVLLEDGRLGMAKIFGADGYRDEAGEAWCQRIGLTFYTALVNQSYFQRGRDAE